MIVLLIVIALCFKRTLTKRYLIGVCATTSYLFAFAASAGESITPSLNQIFLAAIINGTISFAFSYLIGFLVFRKRIRQIKSLDDTLDCN